MPKVKRKKKKAPAGFDQVADVLDEFEERLRAAESSDDPTDTRKEKEWAIFQIHHQRSRYIYEMFYKKKEISKHLYDFLLREKYADASLIAKWKKSGFERLCCLRCIATKDTAFGGTCICRVPKKDLGEEEFECNNCGCTGCSSSD